MSYTLKDAPPRNVLPKAALELWVRVWNSVYDETGDEDQARQAAWAQVKRKYHKDGEGKWVKGSAAAEIEDGVSLPVGALRILEHVEAMALPKATLSKVYAEFKLLGFGEPNANGDGFRIEDVTDEVVATLIGTPIWLHPDVDEHPEKAARATDRAKYQVGSAVFAEKREDGVYCIGSFQREHLEDRGIHPATMAKTCSVSMEVTFDRAKATYQKGDRTFTHTEAVESGIASPLGTPDDRTKYDVRYISPIEFHGIATLWRGRNADKSADVLRVAASEDGIEWAEDDFQIMLATTAEDGTKAEPITRISGTDEDDMGQADAVELSTKERKRLPKDDFAYVDDEGKGHLPIHDEEHVRNALARLNQTDIPAAAKRKALRKIIEAAKRMHVALDMDSDVMKRYGADMAMEDRMAKIQEAFREHHDSEHQSSPMSYPLIRATHDDHMIVQDGDKLHKIPFKQKGDAFEFGDPQEVEVVYKPVKSSSHGASMSDQKIEMTKEDFDKAVEAKAKELLEAQRAEIEAAAVEKVRAEIEKGAVEKFRGEEKVIADRVKELEGVLAFKDETERSAAEQKVREAGDAGFNALKIERLQAALRAANEKAEATANGRPAPALRGAPTGSDYKDPFDVDVRKS